jgi:sec-independent protein translocase protein TatA
MLGDILQPTHLLLVLVVALLVLGPKRLPGAGRALGQGLREFRSSIGGHDSDDHGSRPYAPTPEAQPPAPRESS